MQIKTVESIKQNPDENANPPKKVKKSGSRNIADFV